MSIFCIEWVGQGENAKMYPGYTTEKDDMFELDSFMEFNPHLSFGRMANSLLTLFNIAVMAQWSDVIWPIMTVQPYLVPMFSIYLLIGTFAVLNVVVAMIVDSVMK